MCPFGLSISFLNEAILNQILNIKQIASTLCIQDLKEGNFYFGSITKV